MKEERKKEVKGVYGILLKIALVFVSYGCMQHIPNETSKLIFTLISLGLIIFIFFEILKYYLSQKKDFYKKHKVPILFVSFALIIFIVFTILYFQQGEITDLFWYTLIPSIILYFGTLVKVLIKK